MSTTGRLFRDINNIAYLKDGHPYEKEASHYFLTPAKGGGVSFVKDEIPSKESVKKDLLRIPFKDIPFFRSYVRWKSLSRVIPEFSHFREGCLAFLFDKDGIAIPCVTPLLVRKFSPFAHLYRGLWVPKEEASLVALSLIRIKTGDKPEAFCLT